MRGRGVAMELQPLSQVYGRSHRARAQSPQLPPWCLTQAPGVSPVLPALSKGFHNLQFKFKQPAEVSLQTDEALSLRTDQV